MLLKNHFYAKDVFLEYKYKIKPHSVPFTLNNAVDNLCKKEFGYIQKKKTSPLFF